MSILLVMLTVFILPGSIGRVHAATTGLVCLEDLTAGVATNPCGSSGAGPIFDAPLTSPNHQIKIGVFVNGSSAFNAFDIILKANSTVLSPAGVDISGSILTSPIIVAKCLGLLNITRNTCQAASSDTLEFAAASFTLTQASSTGLLFTAIYNVTGKTSSAIPVGFQIGCLTSSVGGGVCVTFANGSRTQIPETVQSAQFDNSVSIPYLSIAITGSAVPTPSRSTQTFILSLTKVGDWSSNCPPCTVTLSTVQDSSIVVSLNTTSVSMVRTTPVLVSMNITGSKAENYTVAVLGQYQSHDQVNFAPDTLVAQLAVRVQITDFSVLTSLPGNGSFLVGTNASTTITVTSLNGFAGIVTLTDVVPTGLSCGALSLNTVTGSGSATVSCSSATTGSFALNITGTSIALAHSATAVYKFASFTVSASVPAVAMIGQLATSTVTVAAVSSLSGTVSLSATPAECTLSQNTLAFSSSSSTLLACGWNTAGNYTATVTLTSQYPTQTLSVHFSVQDFAISLVPTSQTFTAGSSGNVTLSVAGLNGFSRTVSLKVVAPNGLTYSLTSSSLTVPGSVNLKFSSGSSGDYNVTVTVSYGVVSHSTSMMVRVTGPGGSSTLFGIAPILFYTVIGVVGVLLVVVSTIIVRRARRSSSSAGSRVKVRKKS